MTSPAAVSAVPSPSSFLAALPATRFRGMRRPLAGATATLVLFAVVLLVLVAGAYRPPVTAVSDGAGDAATYSRIVERMRQGEGYYPAAHAELRDGAYGTRSVFNWRLPTLSWIESRLPSLLWANALLGLAALAALLAAARFVATSADRTTGMLVIPALIVSLLSCTAPSAAFFTEIVAGVLILASVSAYGLKRPVAGFLLAFLALFIRELAAPYIVVCIALAWRERRFVELAAWAVGLVAFATWFAWHATMVQAMLGTGDLSYPDGWLQLGGVGFVLATAKFNGALLAAPLWVSAILLPLCLLGLIAWRGAGSLRVGMTVALYLAAFAIVGKPFNTYWGALYTPLMMIGLAFVPAAIRDLVASLRSEVKAA